MGRKHVAYKPKIILVVYVHCYDRDVIGEPEVHRRHRLFAVTSCCVK